MKKKTILFLSTMLALSLTGCSGIKNHIKNQILQQSGVLEEEDYNAPRTPMPSTKMKLTLPIVISIRAVLFML